MYGEDDGVFARRESRSDFLELEKYANCEECGIPIYPDYTICAECERQQECEAIELTAEGER